MSTSTRSKIKKKDQTDLSQEMTGSFNAMSEPSVTQKAKDTSRNKKKKKKKSKLPPQNSIDDYFDDDDVAVDGTIHTGNADIIDGEADSSRTPPSQNPKKKKKPKKQLPPSEMSLVNDNDDDDDNENDNNLLPKKKKKKKKPQVDNDMDKDNDIDYNDDGNEYNNGGGDDDDDDDALMKKKPKKKTSSPEIYPKDNDNDARYSYTEEQTVPCSGSSRTNSNSMAGTPTSSKRSNRKVRNRPQQPPSMRTMRTRSHNNNNDYAEDDDYDDDDDMSDVGYDDPVDRYSQNYDMNEDEDEDEEPRFKYSTVELADGGCRNSRCCLIAAGVFFILIAVGVSVLMLKMTQKDDRRLLLQRQQLRGMHQPQ